LQREVRVARTMRGARLISRFPDERVQGGCQGRIKLRKRLAGQDLRNIFWAGGGEEGEVLVLGEYARGIQIVPLRGMTRFEAIQSC